MDMPVTRFFFHSRGEQMRRCGRCGETSVIGAGEDGRKRKEGKKMRGEGSDHGGHAQIILNVERDGHKKAN